MHTLLALPQVGFLRRVRQKCSHSYAIWIQLTSRSEFRHFSARLLVAASVVWAITSPALEPPPLGGGGIPGACAVLADRVFTCEEYAQGWFWDNQHPPVKCHLSCFPPEKIGACRNNGRLPLCCVSVQTVEGEQKFIEDYFHLQDPITGARPEPCCVVPDTDLWWVFEDVPECPAPGPTCMEISNSRRATNPNNHRTILVAFS